MNITRRGFLGSILAAAVAPAIVRADSLMRIIPREALVMTAPLRFVGEPISLARAGSVLVQWVDDERGTLNTHEFTEDGRFTVPKVDTVWISAYGAGGGGGGSGKMISPTRDDQGQIFNEPMRVQRGTVIPVTIGKA